MYVASDYQKSCLRVSLFSFMLKDSRIKRTVLSISNFQREAFWCKSEAKSFSSGTRRLDQHAHINRARYGCVTVDCRPTTV